MKLPQEVQSHPSGFFSAPRSRALMVSSARVRFLKANVSLGLRSLSSFFSAGKGRFFGFRDFPCNGCVEVALELDADAVLELVGGGRSAAQTSQHRKVDWFSSVHVGQIQGVSYELLSAVILTGSSFPGLLDVGRISGGGLGAAGVVLDEAGGDD
jgi:hypothetical protein